MSNTIKQYLTLVTPYIITVKYHELIKFNNFNNYMTNKLRKLVTNCTRYYHIKVM